MQRSRHPGPGHDPERRPAGSLIRVPQDYPTIQQAINAANPLGGSRIEVAAGTYPENLVVDRRLDLVGSGLGATYVNAASPGSSSPHPR